MADAIKTGYVPGGYLGAFVQGGEDNYLRAQRAIQEQQAAQKAADEHMSATGLQAYRDAQIKQMQDTADTKEMNAQNIGLVKQQQAALSFQQNIQPVIQALSADTQDAIKAGDMGRLRANAERYNQIETSLPPALRSLMSKSSTYTDVNNKSVPNVQSNLDPDMLANFAKNGLRTKENASIENTATKTASQEKITDMVTARDLELQKMKNDIAKTIAAEKDRNKARTWYQDFKQLDDDVAAGVPGAKERLGQWLTNFTQAHPPTVINTVNPAGGIEHVPNRPPVDVAAPGDKPDPLGIR